VATEAPLEKSTIEWAEANRILLAPCDLAHVTFVTLSTSNTGSFTALIYSCTNVWSVLAGSARAARPRLPSTFNSFVWCPRNLCHRNLDAGPRRRAWSRWGHQRTEKGLNFDSLGLIQAKKLFSRLGRFAPMIGHGLFQTVRSPIVQVRRRIAKVP
jgi:hypothetical protein